MAGKREAVLLMTHFVDDAIVALYRRLRAESGGRDTYVLLNQTDNPDPGFPIPGDVEVSAFTVADLRALGYPLKGRRIRDKDIELFSFTFWKRHRGRYDRIWVVEYDVVFTGAWHELFDAFADDDAGLLATSVHRHAVNPGWPNWPSVRTPDGPPDLSRMVRAFMPLYRLTDEAYRTLDAAYRMGWEGFYEGIVPAILMQAGLEVEDIGGDGEFVRPGNENRFYTSTPSDDTLSPGTFVFRPVHAEAGPEPGQLWHPVKPPAHQVGWPIQRRQRIVHRARVVAARLTQMLGR
ncbi:MAG: hypothetical protein AB1918_07940 [Pseudomonadota bacterium]